MTTRIHTGNYNGINFFGEAAYAMVPGNLDLSYGGPTTR